MSTQLERLKKVRTLPALALMLGVNPRDFSYIIYVLPDGKKYSEFTIPKKNGGKRKILAPCKELKIIQKELSLILLDCENEIRPITPQSLSSTLAHGFKRDLSIQTNAAKHTNKRHVFNIDLKDFFPSINFGRVLGFLTKDKNFKLPINIASIIAQIVCFKNELPQGSPCSPVISNYIGHILDTRLARFAKKNKCCYSRYADDITFSTNKKLFPVSVAYLNDSGIWQASLRLHREINLASFCINNNKVAMHDRNNRQVTTGLIVNKKVNIPREYYDDTRSMCNYLFKKGLFFIEYCEGSINQLDGRLNYIYQVKKHSYNQLNIKERRFIGRPECKHNRDKPEGIIKLYRNFLYYKYFFYPSKPIMVCEGKTDYIYIKCALIKLAATYPKLIKINPDGTHEFQINFFQFSKKTHEILGISSGAGGLTNIAQQCQQYLNMFLIKQKRTVFFVSDNDKAGKWFKTIIKPNFFGLIKDNLHALIIPLAGTKTESVIEDLFDTTILGTILDGKTFNPVDGKSYSNYPAFDNDKHYGKKIFAEAVIKKNISTINFNNFKPLFDYMSSQI